MQVICEQDLTKIAALVAKGSMFTAWEGKADQALLVMYVGQSLGLNWFYSLSNISVINGRPVVWGDAMMALCQQSKHMEYCKETFDPETMTATCEAKRVGQPLQTRTFSKADAVRAKLHERHIWKSYPERMLQMRARGFALRDVFPDVLQGLGSAEEVRDYELIEPSQVVSLPSSTSSALLNKGKFAEQEAQDQQAMFETRRDKVLARLDELDVTQEMILSQYDLECVDDITQPILHDMIEMGKQMREVALAA